jgi:hypothetical protein
VQEKAEVAPEGAAIEEAGALAPDAARMRDVLLSLPEPEPELTAALASRLPPEQLAALLRRLWASRQAALTEALGSVKNEAQQMQEALAALLAAQASAEDKVAALAELEYFVTTIHNAEDLVAMGGLSAVVHLLNDTSADVARHAAWVLGTAVKSAPALQRSALSEGAMPGVLALLERALHEHAAAGAALDAPGQVDALASAAKAVYALGGLMRGSGEAQAQFVVLGGARTLAHALATAASLVAAGSNAESGGPPVPVPRLTHSARGLCSKALTLLADVESEAAAGAVAPVQLAGSGNGDVTSGEAPVTMVRVDVDGAGSRTASVIQQGAAVPGTSASVVRGVPLVGGGGDADAAGAARLGLLRRLRQASDGDRAATAFCDAVRAAASACSRLPSDASAAGAADEAVTLVAAETAAASARAWQESGLEQVCSAGVA